MADVNVALGLVCKHYLERIVEGKSPQEALSLTEKAFPTCVSVKSDLEKGIQFWNQLYQGIQVLSKAESIHSSTFDMFRNTDQWLQKNIF